MRVELADMFDRNFERKGFFHAAKRSDQKGDYVFLSAKPAETTRVYENKD